MDGNLEQRPGRSGYPVEVYVDPAFGNRDRLTTAFRILLAIPHLLLVGAPMAAVLSWTWTTEEGLSYEFGGGGVLGAVAGIVAIISWFAIVFSGKQPDGLWNLSAFYLRWRVRAVAYTALLSDDYPPFGDADYPVRLEMASQPLPRDRLTVAVRLILAIPHLILVWVLGIAWMFTTFIAWLAILVTGRYPVSLYGFGAGVLRWNTRVEAYVLLLHDEYPPFSLE